MSAGDLPAIEGDCDPRFARVHAAFAENFARDGELGAAVAVTLHGRPVVDLWGGWRDAARTQPWQRDTIVCMMSVAKAVSAFAVHMLADRGLIELDAPIAQYWPEFAQAGKARIPVRWALSHMACVPVADKAPVGAIYDSTAMEDALAAQTPLWEPGTERCYHSATLGFICGAIVRRVTGLSLGAFLRQEIARPLGLDYHIGLGPDEAERCAEMIRAKGSLLDLAQTDPKYAFLARMWRQLPPDEDYNSPAWRAAEIPSANGHGNARAIARLCGLWALGGTLDGVRLISAGAMAQAVEEQWSGQSAASGLRFRVAMGFFLNCPPDRPMGPNPRAFGHSGAGGAQAIADPVSGIGFAYSPNRMHGGIDIGPRAQRLIEATFACA